MLELDLHIHSKYSFDSLVEPKTILKVAKKRGLDVIAITDHETLKGALMTQQLKQDLGIDLQIVIGVEIHTNIGDIIGLFIQEEIHEKEIHSVIDNIHSQDGIVLLPHPFKGHTISDIKKIRDRLDLLEYFNARTPLTLEQSRIAKGLGTRLFSATDAHFTSEIGLCRTIIPDIDNLNAVQDLKKTLLGGSRLILRGSFSPSYVVSASQLIKTIKLEQYQKIPRRVFTHLRYILREIKSWSTRNDLIARKKIFLPTR